MALSPLRTVGGRIVDADGRPVRLRGVGVGGWMNLEDFINGHPGAESDLRAAMAEALGPARAETFFERLADHFLAEADLAFLRGVGANVVRLALNYRHFERDDDPFTYLEGGFQRLDRALDWCARHEVYAILDLHAAPGWQNPDWHSDNPLRRGLFWEHRQFQDRFVALWQQIAHRYRGNPAVAGYDLLNEPVTHAAHWPTRTPYVPDWPALNALYRRSVEAIRAVDPDHVVILEGDLFARRFDGLEPPFAPNLVYSSHNYTSAGFGPGAYPDPARGWDRQAQERWLLEQEGTRFARQHGVPLLVGEFGATYSGAPEERADRVRALADQLDVLEAHGAHWTIWTYKDVGVMGLVQLDPASAYLRRVAPITQAKQRLATDFWAQWLPPTEARQTVSALARQVEQAAEELGLPLPVEPAENDLYLGQAALSIAVATLLQPAYADLFRALSDVEVDAALGSFALAACRPNEPLVELLKARFTAGEPPTLPPRPHLT